MNLDRKPLTLRQYKHIQDTLNERTVPDWKKVLTTNNFKVAMFDEFSELLNSSPWKWWSHGGECDAWNLKIEAIDVFHFALSIYILTNASSHLSEDSVFCEYNKEHNYMIDNNGRIDHNVFINKALGVLNSNVPSPMEELFESLGMSALEISAIYTAKSELNYIRQDNGYKTGKYTKVVDGIEDNERLKDIVEDFMFDTDMGIDDLRESVRSNFFIGPDEDVDLELLGAEGWLDSGKIEITLEESVIEKSIMDYVMSNMTNESIIVFQESIINKKTYQEALYDATLNESIIQTLQKALE